MKIAPKDTNAFLAKAGEARAVLLYGPDGGLSRERALKLKRGFLGEQPDPLSFTELSEAQLGADPVALNEAWQSMSLMGGVHLIWLRDATDKMTKLIEESSAYWHKDAFLIVTAAELGPRSSLRAWFEKSLQAAALASYRDEARDVSQLVQSRFREAGITYEAGVIEHLVTQLGNDRFVTQQELEKLITYAGEEKRLSIADARALVDYNGDAPIELLLHAVADRNAGATDRLLKILLVEQTPPIVILRSLQRYMLRLLALKNEEAAGIPLEQAISALKPPVFFKHKSLLENHVRRWQMPHIMSALKQISAAERDAKRGDGLDALLLSRNLLRLSFIKG